MSTLVTNCDIINCDSYGLYAWYNSYGLYAWYNSAELWRKKRVICGMLVETGVI